MSIFDIEASQERARQRLQSAPKGGRRPRSDRGQLRIDPRVLGVLVEATAGYDRPSMAAMRKLVDERCRRHRLTPPSRASIYKLLATLPTPRAGIDRRAAACSRPSPWRVACHDGATRARRGHAGADRTRGRGPAVLVRDWRPGHALLLPVSAQPGGLRRHQRRRPRRPDSPAPSAWPRFDRSTART